MRASRGTVLALLVLAGCAAPTPPGPAPSAEQAAADEARREERQRIMEQYWQEQTGALGGAEPRPPPALLSYPAGIYDGLAFGPRTAADPSLGEPAR